MSSITFLGASGTVTGSSFLLTTYSGMKVLIDMGMFQGNEDSDYLKNFDIQFEPSEINCVLLTHAHIDHCGRLPMLAGSGFKGKIYTTEASVRIMEIALYDSARIAKDYHAERPLYLARDVDSILTHVKTVKYNQSFEIGELTVTYKDAGHILGSAFIEIVEKSPSGTKKIIFSGDIGNYPEEIVNPTEFPTDADYVVMESTYGDTVHPSEDTIGIIQNEINTIERSGDALLIPSFAIDRTQTLLYIIKKLKMENKIDYQTPVYLDSPMGIRVTEVYKGFRSLYNPEIYNLSKNDNPFDFAGLEMVEEGRASDHIRHHKGPKIILAGNGMVSGGRILKHVVNYMSFANTRMLIVGYQAEGTFGRQLLEGVKVLEIDKKIVRIKGNIKEIKGLSAHADQTKLLKWLGSISGVKKVFLVHGEDVARECLVDKIKETNKSIEVILPNLTEVSTI
ncbi:MAG: MBL fold metallo-hydrolase [bacterium]|nr:MBL fold metallo-hydrolase [bacterium]